jgi:hypothetical protein
MLLAPDIRLHIFPSFSSSSLSVLPEAQVLEVGSYQTGPRSLPDKLAGGHVNPLLRFPEDSNPPGRFLGRDFHLNILSSAKVVH